MHKIFEGISITRFKEAYSLFMVYNMDNSFYVGDYNIYYEPISYNFMLLGKMVVHHGVKIIFDKDHMLGPHHRMFIFPIKPTYKLNKRQKRIICEKDVEEHALWTKILQT